MNNPTVSIIVPVYRVEEYLRTCIDSVLSQTYTNFELLLIDDGSLDNSGKICDEYAEIDSRIKVFHQKNHGVSSARNLGIKYAVGEWLMFVDSDDSIKRDCIECCVKNIDDDNLDLIQFSYDIVNSDGKVKSIKKNCTSNIKPKDYVKSGNINVTVWGALIRTTLIKNSKIQFNNGIKYAEDKLFIFECIQKSLLIKMLPDILYNYSVNTNGAIHNMDSIGIINSYEELLRFSKNNTLFFELINMTLLGYCWNLVNNGDIDSHTIKYYFKLYLTRIYGRNKFLLFSLNLASKLNTVLTIRLLARLNYRM